MTDDFLTIADAAAVIDVSRSTIYRMIADGSIATQKVRGRRLVERASIGSAVDPGNEAPRLVESIDLEIARRQLRAHGFYFDDDARRLHRAGLREDPTLPRLV